MELTEKDYPGLSNEILFNRYTGGDLKAFDELLTRTKGLVHTLIMRYVKDFAEADEIFQEVFLKVCKNKDLFREAVSFKSWLVTITKNTCIDHTRKKRRSFKTDPLDDAGNADRRPLSDVLPGGAPGPAEDLVIQVENEELSGLLDRLPAEQRDTFYLKVVMEFTFEEIGESMNCSTNTAKSRYRYSLETLRGLVRRKRMLEKTA